MGVILPHPIAAQTSVNLGSNKHLFIDNYLLDTVTNAKLTVNSPTVKEIVMTAEKPWEENGITSYCNVFWDPYYNEYRLYYVPISYAGDPAWNLCLATSTDGVNWTKPNLGAVSWGGNTNNNIVIIGQREGTVIIDPNTPAGRRYAYLSSRGDLKTRLFTSADGIHWTMDDTMIADYHSDSQISTFWDDQRQKYVHFPRKSGDVVDRPRAIGRYETAHMNEVWTTANISLVMAGDSQDPSYMDLYTNSIQKYALTKNTYVGFPTPYYHYDGAGRDYLKKGGNDGVIETQLATSRDGITWTRYRTPYIPLQKYEDLDIKIAMVFPGLIYTNHHIYQYFAGYTFTHGDPNARTGLQGRDLGGLFRLEQRIDGFTSMDFDYAGGTVLTKPFTFNGKVLALNVDTSAAGEGRVAICDEAGTEITGFTLDDCRIISGDYLEKIVAWGIADPVISRTDVSSLAGTTVRLKFSFRGTKLYSFGFLNPLIGGNIAPQATPSASSEHPGYTASKAVDGIIGASGNGEWASNGELNPWIKLDWSSSRTINKVVLYDRANLTDDVNGGTLSFSDGSSISVTRVENDGIGKEVTFADKVVTWVKFQVSGGSGQNVGLSEIEVFEATQTHTPSTQNFTTDPAWASSGNRISPQNFGFSNTNNCGDGAGEMGGTVSRASIAWYGDSSINPFSINSNLYMEGKVNVTNAGEGNVMIGWFNPSNSTNMTWPHRNFMGFRTDGTGDNANVYIYYGKSDGTYGQSGIVYTCTQGTPFTYSFTYNPNGTSDGLITMYFNGDMANPKILTVPVADKAVGANYTHFGMCSLYTGGSYTQQVYIDSIKYTRN